MDRMKNNAYASTDPLSKNKNIYNFLVPNQYHRLKSITKPTPLLSLPYTKSLGVFADMCSYTGLHDNSDISFFFNFSMANFIFRVSAISNFLSVFFFPIKSIYRRLYLESILFSPFPDIGKFLQALVSCLKDFEWVKNIGAYF